MNYTSSRSTRRIIGRLSKGESLIASLQRLCKRERERAGAVRGIGLLRNVELQTYSAEKRRYETTLSGTTSFELLSLEGNISTLGELIFINSYVHVGTHHLGQWQTFGGLLVEAEAISFEFILDARRRPFPSSVSFARMRGSWKSKTFWGSSGGGGGGVPVSILVARRSPR